MKIDYIGLGLIALGIGCLQMVLDKGQELDWFGIALDRRRHLRGSRDFDHLGDLGMAPSASDRRAANF